MAQQKSKKEVVIDGKKYYLHKVEKGQTLYNIAKIYKLDVDDIVLENPDVMNGIKLGQELKIPFVKPVKKEIPRQATNVLLDTSKYRLYKVEQGQTLYSISKKFNVKTTELEALNPDLKSGLKSNQEIKIPLNDKNRLDLEKVKPTIVVNTPLKKDSIISNILEDTVAILKSDYNIALLLPFQLSSTELIEVESILKKEQSFSQKTEIALQFYQGAIMAIDSLRKQGLKANIYVYDIDENDSSYMRQFLNKAELKSMDLFIGPLYTSAFVDVSKFAKENRIPIVCPFIQQNKILFNNGYVCKATPAITTQLEREAEFIAEKYYKKNIVLVDNKLPKEIANANAVRNKIKPILILNRENKNDSLKIAQSFSELLPILDKVDTNIIVIPSANQSYVSDFLRMLYGITDKYKIVVFGLSAWNSFDNIDIEYLNLLQVHYPTNTFINYDNDEIKTLVKKYRDAYFTEPENYFFQGYDITYYSINGLMKYGNKFMSKLPKNNSNGLQTKFSYYKPSSESGYENRGVYILRYSDYKIVNAE